MNAILWVLVIYLLVADRLHDKWKTEAKKCIEALNERLKKVEQRRGLFPMFMGSNSVLSDAPSDTPSGGHPDPSLEPAAPPARGPIGNDGQ